MRFTFAPLEQRDGSWQVNFPALILYTLLLCLGSILLSLWIPETPQRLAPVPARAMRHPVVVTAAAVTLLETADEAGKAVRTLHRGDTVDLFLAQPAGWYHVTVPDAREVSSAPRRGYHGGVSGYVRQLALQVPDSTLQAVVRMGQ